MSVNVYHADVQSLDAARTVNGNIAPTDTIMQSASLSSYDGRYLSPVRRTFCLITLFDMIFIFLLWIIYSQLSGMNIHDIFLRQVAHYSIQTSMFDNVMLSVGRFISLTLAYGLFKLNHWWVVALTTTVTSAFLLAKVFFYDFREDNTTAATLDYVLLVCCFVIGWIEVWFLDFKVIPTEKRYEFLDAQHSIERAPLLPGTVQPNHYHSSSHSGETASGGYYSPFESSESEGEFEDAEPGPHRAHGHGHGAGSHRSAARLFLTLQAEIATSAKEIFRLVIQDISKAPLWNPTLLENRVLQHVNEHVDVIYTVTADVGAGTVSSRDFVTARCIEKRDGVYLSAGCGTNHAEMLPTNKYVRGENRVAGYVIKSAPNNPDKCIFTWVVNSNLKGWLPQALVEQGIATMMVDYMSYLRKYVAEAYNTV
ncbi:PREDICTED: stAR-related lipid transfer protein 3-like [Priapulus caudatus]|uniref:StAR-related lipid transfer protein 3-like n=1 Tax=Priapulus caudatus TaxID=37621 RepID=A0ABM1E3Y3_PRICU|nr:PREDICTED: stAR-related lipid transfer protein 3-like [Priapulus caudatus]